MNWFRRLAREFRDSPNYIRDRANLVTGVTIGTTALLLNLAVFAIVGPFIMVPDDPDFLAMTESVGLGQLLALLLLGGATILATLLIPLRLMTVFWGPRIGRYFDQIVLSGISPVRFVIGKAMSQNLFLALILFLLLPYFVLCLTIGGVHLGVFLACLVLLWLYCIALALVTIWLSLYFNELIAGLMSISCASLMIGLGCIPSKLQPFVLTPAPALMQPVYSLTPSIRIHAHESFLPVFCSSLVAMSLLSLVALVGIYLGPLYGIVRENSTFGEVVRKGDSKKKRWFRFRYHIQRPSEIAFLYENRDNVFENYEGLIRWGLGCAILAIALLCSAIFFPLTMWRSSAVPLSIHFPLLLTHASTLLIAILLFSHGKNSTLQRLRFFRRLQVRVSRLDTIGFLTVLCLSNLVTVAVAFGFERYLASPLNLSIFRALKYGNSGPMVDYLTFLVEGSLIISVAGLVLYALHRYMSTFNWVKSISFVSVCLLYWAFVCMGPLFFVGLYIEFRRVLPFAETFPLLSQISPLVNIIFLAQEFPRDFDQAAITRMPFYATHAIFLIPLLFSIRRRERKIAELYFPSAPKPTRSSQPVSEAAALAETTS